MNEPILPGSHFTRPRSIAAMLALGVLGPAVFLILPVVVGALAQSHGFDEDRLGTLASGELGGIALACLSALYWSKRWSWRRMALCGVVAVATANLLSATTSGFSVMLWLRFAAGFGGGILLALVMAFLSNTKNPDRTAAFLVGAQVGFQVIAFAVSPQIISSWGVNGFFIGLALLTAGLLPFLRFLPPGAPAPDSAAAGAIGPRALLPGFVVLLSMALFFVGQVALWAFIERLGDAAGLTATRVAGALSISAMAGLAGPAGAAWLGDRWGRALPLAVACAMQLAALVLIGTSELSFAVFLAALAIFSIFWNFALPYQFGAMVGVDPLHRLIVLVPTFQAAGIAVGPILAGATIARFGLGSLWVSAAIPLVLYAACIIPFTHSESESEHESA